MNNNKKIIIEELILKIIKLQLPAVFILLNILVLGL